MSQARRDDQRTRFRRPLGMAVMAYKAILGLSEATFARLSAEELREDPGDRFVALISRHLPALLRHRGLVAVGLVLVGLAKLVAAAAMWEGRSGAATCSLRPWHCCCPSMSARPSPPRRPATSCWPWRTRPCWLCWVLLLRGRLPSRPRRSPASPT
jgi:hypothetical protein